MKKFISIFLKGNRPRVNSLTIKRKEGYEPIGRVTLLKKTSEEYCMDREKRLNLILTAIGQ